jgi:peptidoglycan/xylan/chitin deacetylase (PgdA/CDA1 family)
LAIVAGSVVLSLGSALGTRPARAETAPTVSETATGPQAAAPQPPAPLGDPPSAPGLKLATAPDCAARPDLLGISRIVEIDTATSPHFGSQYKHVEPAFLEDHEIVLTFDDGPAHRYTMPILDALDAQCTKATFFSVGRMAVADPATLREVARRGHTIGFHTWSHKNLRMVGAEAQKREIELGLSAVAKASGVPVAPFFRFPYLADSKSAIQYLATRGIGTFGIHVDSKDFRTRNPGVVMKKVLAELEREKKGIILFHDIQPSTAGALSSLLAELKTRGYKVVHMVPRTAATTLPEFDAIAEKALKAKEIAAAKEPLADRAITWPVTGSVSPTDAEAAPATSPAQPRATAKARPRRTPSKQVDWFNPEDEPWRIKVFGSQ